MALRKRDGRWYIRFKHLGKSWTKTTGLEATERNRSAALIKEAEMRQKLMRGEGNRIRVRAITFNDAADQFIEWSRGVHRDHPNTWKRLRGSMASLKAFFGAVAVHAITVGAVLDYMSWRRRGDPQMAPVKDVTLRHDLHALGPLFRYAKAHNWCASNPVEEVDIPGDRDAVRVHIISPAEEMVYFETCLALERENLGRAEQTKRPGAWIRAARDFRALYDVTRLMLLQGPRPYIEVTRARAADVDLERGIWTIPESKSNAGRRTLKLLAESRSILGARMGAAGERGDGWLFPGKKPGTPLTDIQHSHQRVLRTASLDFVVYDFRHTAATRWAERGMGVIELARILGHRDLRTVQRYVHLGEEHVHAAMLRFGQICTETDGSNAPGAEERKGERWPKGVQIE